LDSENVQYLLPFNSNAYPQRCPKTKQPQLEMLAHNEAQRKGYVTAKIVITGIAAILIFGFLFWEHFHGGVSSHFILHDKDLPEISNWWGGLLLPGLTWLLLGKIEKRLNNQKSVIDKSKSQKFSILVLFIVGIILGVLISVSFTSDYKPILDNILYVILVLSLLVRIYYAEFMLGFILGMIYTFGVVIPTIFIFIIGAVGFLLYRFIRPLFLSAARVLKK
jgi:hypothetical protein